MTKYVIAPSDCGIIDITPGNRYEVFDNGQYEHILDSKGRVLISPVWLDWPVHHENETKSDAELLAEIAARNPSWNLPEAPDRAEEIMRAWRDEWDSEDLGQLTNWEDFGLFIARKLLKEGVIK